MEGHSTWSHLAIEGVTPRMVQGDRMSDGGKGSERRNEDPQKVRDNWDLIDWSKKSDDKKQQPEQKKS